MKWMVCLLLTLVLLACSKNEPEVFCVDATVEYMGNPAADGLGWVLKQQDSTGVLRFYVPDNLSNQYHKIGLLVKACLYKTDETADCFCAAPPNKYHITSIALR